jgi:hypothetical protein
MRQWNIGRLTPSAWYDLSILEKKLSTISSWGGLGQILFWFATYDFRVKAWALGLVWGKGEAAEGPRVSCGATSAVDEGWGGGEVSIGCRTIEEAWDTRHFGTLLHQTEEANRCAREASAGGTTSETWPPPGNFSSCYFHNLINCCNSCLKGLTSAFVIFFLL